MSEMSCYIWNMSSLTNALAILSSFKQSAPELGVTELASRLALPKSSVSRLMSELESGGFLERTPDRRYRPGVELLRIGSLYKLGLPPVDRIDAELKTLLSRYPASGYIAINRGIDTVVLRMREGTSAIRFIVPEGSIVPAFSVGIGKAILARLSDGELEDLLPAHAHCDEPFYDLPKDRLMEELQEIRQRRWADLRDMAHRGVDAVAIAIKPEEGDAVGIALSFMTSTAGCYRDEMIEALLQIGERLGPALGDAYWRPRS